MMTHSWLPVDDSERLAVAIYNYCGDGERCLVFSLGDVVHVLQRCAGWCYGYTASNPDFYGVFPASYVRLKKCIVDKTTGRDTVVLRENPLLHEITAVIREWGQICRSLFVSRDDKLAETRRMLLQLIVHRRRIVSGTLPADELRTIKRVVTSTIDRGNLLLGLDLVVRDEQGNMINPDLISAVELYRHHHRATQHMYTTQSRNSGDVSSRSSSVSSSHCLYVSIENFVSRVEEDCELILFLYDASSQRVLTENYIVVWGKELLTRDLHQLANMRVLFTDLSSVDVGLDRLYLVCFVVKTGVSCRSELSSRRASQASFKNSITHSTATLSSLGGEQCRRPCGVAALELSPYISDGLTSDEDKHHFMPFLQCGEKENLEGTLKKIVAMRDIGNREHKGHGLWFSFKFLQGDITEVRSGHPHLVMGPMSVALKRDFPDLLEPGGERNDLYLTLTAGEFGRGGKGQDRNVEVTVRVLNADGHVMPDAILPGAGCTPVEQYRSVVYRHEGRPRWAENIKVKLTVEEYDLAHLRFTFKHRSANEMKDKSERPFALAFLRLKENSDIALRNRLHDLNVFRLEGKRYDEGDTSYLRLPSHREDVATASRSSTAEYALSSREFFSVESQLCSDGLTQNVDLLQVLQCRSGRPDVLGKLHLLHRVPREELLRFLRAVLDVLFYVLDSHQQSADVVFSALLTLISSVDDQKYHQFQAVLDKYLEDDFSSVLVGGKLIGVMQGYLDNLSDSGSHRQLVKSLKCLRYICKITIRSHELHYSMYGRAGCDDLGSSVLAMLKGMSSLMNCPLLEAIQLSCLRHIPESLDSLSVVCDPVLLCKVMSELLTAASSESLSTQRLHCISSLVQLQLFQQPECRLQLLPVLTSIIAQLFDVHKQQGVGSMETLRQRGRSTAKLAKLFGEQQTEVIGQDRVQTELEIRQNELHICVRIMGDVLDVLWKLGGASAADMAQITSHLLRQLIQTVICMDRDDPLVCSLAAILISVLRQMNKCHYDFFMSELVHLPDQLFFLMEVLMVFRDLISKCVFPFHWCEMIMLQNSVILKSLRFFSHTIRDRFMQPFEIQMCNNFFHCAIAFLTQAPLQLENFSVNKKSRLLHRYKDMRKATALEIHTMWISLGQHKISFVPSMVGPFLEMTLVPDAELRAMTVPLFFDMMQCEFYSPCRPGVGYGDTKRDAQAIKCNFDQFEREMISKLDHLIEGGRGDVEYLQVFKLKMTENCEKHSSMKEQGLRFVGTVVRLMERLLEYRDIMRDEYRENKMSCTVHLLHFYCEIDCRDMYMRYLDKLCSLHLSASNYIEAGFTLKLHTDLLHWSDEPLSTLLRHARYPHLDTHRALKEALYYCIIDYFDKGNLWEAALQFCKELCVEYELETFDYTQLSRLLRRMSKLYERIMNDIRPPPEYFRVAFYGRAFPAFLQNKVYVYRGHGYERLGDFSCRVQAGFPKSELLSTLSSPGTEITEALQQYLQINKVDPCMDDRQRFSGRAVADRVLQYYRVNEVDRFSYSRPMPRGQTDPDNPFANLWLERTVLRTTYPLPGLLGWAPVEGTSTYDVTPLENAIETMTSVNSQLRQLILSHRSDATLPLNPLTQKLSGTIDAAVMGGIANYEKAFFHGRYLEQRPEDVDMIDRLKLLIAKQIPLLEAALEIHAIRAAADLKPLQQRLEHVFSNMRADVQNKFGHQVSELPCMRQVVRASGSRPVSASEHRRSSESGSCRFTGSPVRSQSVFYKQTGSVGASASSTASQDHLPPDRNRSSLTSQTDSLSSVELPEIRNHRLENERDRTQNSCSSGELSQQLNTNSSSSNTDYMLEFVECAAPPPLPRKQGRQLNLYRSESLTSESSPLPNNSHEQDSSETRA